MKRKLLSVLLTLVLVLTLGLVTAVPVAAQATQREFLDQTRLAAAGNGIAEWVTTLPGDAEVYNGDFAARMAVPADGDVANIVHMGIKGDSPLLLSQITTAKFWEYLVSAGGSWDGSAAIILFLNEPGTPSPAEGTNPPEWGKVEDGLTFHSYGNAALVEEWSIRDLSNVDQDWQGYADSIGDTTVEPLSYWLDSNNWGHADWEVCFISVCVGAGDWAGYEGYIDDFIVEWTGSDYVDTYLTDPRIVNVTQETGHNYIQDAIDDADTVGGHTITVENGLYTEQLTITAKGLTITGESESGVIVQTQADWTTAPTANVFTIDAAGKDITIQNMTIRNGDYGIRSSAGNVNVLHCTLYHNGWDGQGLPSTDLVVDPTDENDPGLLAFKAFWAGEGGHVTDGGAIRIKGSTGSEIAHCTVYENDRGIRFSNSLSPHIHHCVSHDNIESGIYLSSVHPTNPGVDSAIVEHCESYNNMNNGLLDIGGKGNIWRNNNVHDNWTSGVAANYPSEITIQGNTIDNNNIYGFTGEGTQGENIGGVFLSGVADGTFTAKILSNTISNNNRGTGTNAEGIRIRSTVSDDGISILNNTFTNHDVDVYVESQAATTVVNYNNFDGSGIGVQNDDTSATLDATKNWWGDASGPYNETSNPDATGDPVSDNVDYSPWWGASYLSGTAPNIALVIHPWTWYTNDSIQEAIVSATEGDTINVAAGTYDEWVNIGIPLTLSGQSGAIVKPSTLPSNTPIIGINADDVTVEGLEVDGILLTDVWAGIGNNGWWEFEACTDVTIQNNVIHDIPNNPADDNGGMGIGLWRNDDDIYEGILIEGNTVYNTGRMGIYVGATFLDYTGWYLSSVTIRDNIVHDTMLNAIDTFPGGCGGIAIDAAKSSTIEGNTVYNTGTELNPMPGIFLAHGSGAGNQIYGNEVYNQAYGIAVEIDRGDVNFGEDSLTAPGVHFNNIRDNDEYGLIVLNAAGEVVDATHNWWGDATGPDHASNPHTTPLGDAVSDDVDFIPWYATETTTDTTEDVSVEHNGPIIAISDTIQGGIDAALSGDTVIVAAGTYAEAILIDKPLTLLGATHAVNKNGYTVPENYAWDDTVESIINHPNPAGGYIAIVDIVDVDNVTFKGFVVQELDAVGNLNSSLVRVYAHTQEISNIVVRNNVIGPNTNTTAQDGAQGRMGLYIVNYPYSDEFGVVNSTFSGNKIFDCQGNGNNVFIWSSYFDYGATGPASMSGTVIEDNEIYGAHRNGIETAGGFSGLSIRNNKIYGNSGLPSDEPNHLKYGNGILLIRGSSDKLGGPTTAYGPVDLTIESNEIYNNEKNGIYMGPINTGYTITENDIYNNGWDAIRIDLEGTYWNPTFEPVFSDWSCYDGSTNIAAKLNNIYSNIEYGVRVVGTPTNGFVLDAENNWWGAATGPYHATANPGVVAKMGDAVSENVNFSPWLYQSQEEIVPTKKPAYAQSIVLDNYGEYGWNTFSAPIYLDDTADTWANLINLTGLDLSIAYRFDPAAQDFVLLTATDASPITPGEGFFIKMKSAGSLPILYSTVLMPPPSRPLTVGWNLIGLASLEGMTASEALASIATVANLAGYSQVISPSGNESPGAVLAGDTVYVGEAYWLYMLGERTLAGFTTTPVNWVP